MLAHACLYAFLSLGHAFSPQPAQVETRNRLGRLFEGQAYAELLTQIPQPSDDWQRLIKARAQADLSDWQACLDSLGEMEDRQSLSLKAEAYDALGSTLAAAAWKRALRFEDRNPEAAFVSFKAALSALKLGDWARAEDLFKRAEKLDGAYSAVHAKLADLYFEEGRLNDARVRLERALRVDQDNEELRDCLNLLYKAAPALLAEVARDNGKKEERRLARLNPRVTPIQKLDGEPMIRVGLLVRAPSFKFKTGGETCLEPQGLLLPANATFKVSIKAGVLELERLDAEVPVLRAPGSDLELDPLVAASTLSIFDVGYGAGYFWAGSEDRSYRGGMRLHVDSSQGITVVNVLPLEAYLCSVLPAEMPAEWPLAALKAQAVAARSETLAKMGRFSRLGFDVCPDILCAVYKGTRSETPRSNGAVMDTSGMVLEKSKGRSLDAVYMDNSGGHTQEAWEAWSGPKGLETAVFDGPSSSPWASRFPLSPADLIDYLDDPKDDVGCYCSQSAGQPYSSWRWVTRISAKDLGASVNRSHAIGKIKAVEVLERGPSGYVESLRVTGSLGGFVSSSDRVRGTIKGLRSNLFYVETRRDAQGEALEFLFHGGGWGHGVGLSQSGAYGMAVLRKSYKEILKHYFGHATLAQRY